MNATKRYAYIHVGTPKTGTTALQASLFSNYSFLKKEGYLYTKTGLWARGHSYAHHNFAYQLYNYPFFDPKHGTLDELRNELKMWHGHIIISSEIFIGLYDDVAKLSILKNTFNSLGFEVVIIIYFRDCVEYVNNLYAEFVKNHFLQIDINEFVNHILSHGQFTLYDNWVFSFDYVEIVKNFANVFGNENVICVKYNKDKTINKFSQIIGVDLGSEILANRSINQKTMEILIAVNKELSKSNLSEFNHHNINQTIVLELKDLDLKEYFGIDNVYSKKIKERFLKSEPIYRY